ncbi:MAG: hypothetical protein J0H66_11600 [Solirubrobacterales bacterium]|nr:hypothetical protein [Solirubrobacterales bacterium]OJU94786.1 MAG: hypothetical protein BGO23_07995 [Solirubrobacterales bacterium 67-14]
MHRNEKHWLTDEEQETGAWGESLEQAVVEIRNMRPFLETAFSGVEFAAAAIRAKELGFDRSTVFWPTIFPKEVTYGMAWKDDPELVAGIEPPPDLSPGWKLDPHYGDRVRYWNGDEWDVVAAPAPGNLDLYRRIAAGEDVGEVPDAVTIHPANSKEPDPLVETLKGKSEGERESEEPSADVSAGRSDHDEVSSADLRLAEEIARFVAERAFEFDDHEARAWALTDFDVWASLAGESARLSFAPAESDGSGS